MDAGAQDAMQYGVLAGYPLVNLKVTLLDGAYHEVDSSEMAFKIAGSQVLKGCRTCAAGDPGTDHGGRGDHTRGLHG